jgi:signal transduction histidine kinase
MDAVLRLYDEQGRLQQGFRELDQSLPTLIPQEVLQKQSSPAFDPVAGLIPPLVNPPTSPGSGAFGTFVAGDQRWRVYILPVKRGEKVIAYLEAATPLGRLDASMRAFQRLLVALVSVSLILGFAGSWATASGALSPVAQMIISAQTIAHLRDLSRRVEVPRNRDELGDLAEAFNLMLKSLEEASQAQERFVGDASHELRAPLTAIQGNLELLQRYPDIPATDRETALSEASREAHRLSRLVADLLALARADAGIALTRQRVEMDRLVLEAVNEARLLARGQQIDVDKLEPAVLLGDSDRLKQLLLILLDNAIKYTPPQGRIAVELKRRESFIEILVRDTGIGIPEDALPHLFERFYRADPARARDPGGTGLGLSIAQWIAEQHGGTINVQSKVSEETNVIVALPTTMK